MFLIFTCNIPSVPDLFSCLILKLKRKLCLLAKDFVVPTWNLSSSGSHAISDLKPRMRSKLKEQWHTSCIQFVNFSFSFALVGLYQTNALSNLSYLLTLVCLNIWYFIVVFIIFRNSKMLKSIPWDFTVTSMSLQSTKGWWGIRSEDVLEFDS